MDSLSFLLYWVLGLALLVSDTECQRYLIATGYHRIYSPEDYERTVTVKHTTVTETIFYDRNYNYSYFASLACVNSEPKMLVKVLSFDADFAEVRISGGLTAFAYMIVKVAEYVVVGEVSLYFPMPRFSKSGESMAYFHDLRDKIPAHFPNFARIEPFLTEIVSWSQREVVSDVSLSGAIATGIMIRKTDDITKVSFSYLIYLAAEGNMFSEFLPVNTQELLEGDPVKLSFLSFIGNRRIARQLGSSIDSSMQPLNTTSYPYSEFAARYTYTESYYFKTWQRRSCSFMDARNGGSQHHDCISECNQTAEQLMWFAKFCYTPNYTHTVPQANSIEIPGCLFPTFHHEKVICNICNSDQNFVYNKAGYCQCRQGYYQPIHDKQLGICLTCTEQECPSFIQISFMTNSTNYSSCSINLTIASSPSMNASGNDYRQLEMEILINDQKVRQHHAWWPHHNQYNVGVDRCQYADSYVVTVRTLNSVQVHQKDRVYKTLPMKKSKNFKRSAQEKVFIVQVLQHSSVQTAKKIMPAAAFILSLISAQIDLFSFLQIGAFFYASSLIEWPGYISNTRITLTQALFRFEPLNIFTLLEIAGFIKQPLSDDNPNESAMLRLYQSRLYLQISGEILITLLMQILLLQIILRLLTAVLPRPSPEQQEYHIAPNNTIRWRKRAFLTTLMEDKDLSVCQNLGLLVDRIRNKRFVFYHNFILSQMVFHSFLIFGQLKLSVSSLSELYSTSFAVLVLSAIVLFPVFVSRKPLVLFKCAGIVYKKREYDSGKLILFMFYNFWELIVFGASVSLFHNNLHQAVGFTLLAWFKLWLMRAYFKRLELVKALCIALFGVLITLGGVSHDQDTSNILEYVCIGLMMTVCAVQLFKIFRAVVIAILSLFKSPASQKGQRIMEKIKHYRENTEANMILHRE